MKDKKDDFSIGMRNFGITLPLLFLSPFLLNVGFRFITRNQKLIGFSLITLGIILGFLAVYFMTKGIKRLLDHLFEK
jgi:hypothetical protein